MQPFDITVEMVPKELTQAKYLDLLDNDETYVQLLEAWPRIKAGVSDILESFDATAGQVNCIALSKLGFDKHGNNPNTVYIAVDDSSPVIGWPRVLDKVQAYLDGLGFDLHVHLETNIA
jgi:hypothetical protein